ALLTRTIGMVETQYMTGRDLAREKSRGCTVAKGALSPHHRLQHAPFPAQDKKRRKPSASMESCSSSPLTNLQPIISDPSKEQQTFTRLSSFARDFYSVNSDDDSDDLASLCSYDDEEVRKIVEKTCALTMKEARAKFRLELLTPSQWDIVMESCKIEVQRDASLADKVVKVMGWRSERGDFDMHDAGEEDGDEEGLAGTDVDDDDQVPKLCDDMEGVSEACLELGFLKSDLQVECLLRGISYDGRDTKVQLISKLMEHKQSLSLNCLNSFQFLAKQSE
ncbi:hypothetical protein GOP47_0015118, partial [Adiantum capillus-veneris]